MLADDRARADYSNPRLSERHASSLADDQARADYSNLQLSECHASSLADDRARADYSNREAVFGQVGCINSYLVALEIVQKKIRATDVCVAMSLVARILYYLVPST